MDDDLTQKITQRLAELPADVRQAVQSADMAKKIEAPGATYKLHVDQIGELEDETLMVMLGFVEPESFEKRITDSLHLPAEVGKQIAADINRDIFVAVRASLRRFTEEKSAIKAVTPSALGSGIRSNFSISGKLISTIDLCLALTSDNISPNRCKVWGPNTIST